MPSIGVASTNVVQFGTVPIGQPFAGDQFEEIAVSYQANAGATGGDAFSVGFFDSCSGSNAVSVGVTVTAPVTILISPSTVPAATESIAYSQQFSVSGGAGPFTVTATGAVPAGLNMSPSGLLSGTPTVSGTFQFTVNATYASGPSGSMGYTLTVNGPSPPVANGTVDLAITAGGGPVSSGDSFFGTVGQPYTSIMVSGLPASIHSSYDTVAHALTLTALGNAPAGPAQYQFTLSNSSGSASGTLVLTVIPQKVTITLNPASLSAATVGAAYGPVTIGATGGVAPYQFAVTGGALPPGLGLSPAGALSGTPTGPAGGASFTVTATDANGATGTASYSLTVTKETVIVGPASLPAATIGTAYGPQAITATGGTGPYQFVVTSGSLPAGLALSPGGTVTGTATGPTGNSSFTVTATDANGVTGAASFVLGVNAASATITLSPSALPATTLGTAYGPQTITATGGTGPYQFAVTSGTLPAGLTLTAGGSLSGTPTGAAGTFPITVTATDSTGATGSAHYSLVVNAASLTLSPSSLPVATVGVAYSQQISASGGSGPYVFTLTAGTLPAGLTLGANGLLSGTSSSAGSFPLTVSARDSNGLTGAASYTLTVNTATIILSPSSLPAGSVGSAYSQQISASGGAGSATFSETGTLPAGLTLSPSGLLAGTPTASGSFSIAVTATYGNGASSSQRYTLTVNAATLTLSPSSIPTATAGVAYSQQFSASGGTGGYSFTESGALPAGLTLSAGGLLAGTPASSGGFAFTVTAQDGAGSTGSASYTLTVNKATVVTGGLSSVTIPQGGSTTLSDSQLGGGGAPYSNVTVSGPSGVVGTYNASTHQLTLTAQQGATAGTYTFTLVGAGNAVSSETVMIVIALPPTSPASGAPAIIASQQQSVLSTSYVQFRNFDDRLNQLHNGDDNSGVSTSGLQFGFGGHTISPGLFGSGSGGLASMLKGLAASSWRGNRGARGQIGGFFGGSAEGGGTGLFDGDGTAFQPGNRQSGAVTMPPGASPEGSLLKALLGDDQDASLKEELPDRMGVFVNGLIDVGGISGSASSTGAAQTTIGISAGVDYRFNADLIAGLGIGYNSTDSDISGGSKSSNQTVNFTIYGSWRPTEKLFVDFLGGYGDLSFDDRRQVEDSGLTAVSKPGGTQFMGSLTVGYDFYDGPLNLSPYGRFSGSHATIDSASESGAGTSDFAYGQQAVDSVATVLGFRGDYAYSTSFGIITPHARIEYQHEFAGANQPVSVAFVTDASNQQFEVAGTKFSHDTINLGGGVSLLLEDGLSMFVDYEALLGDQHISSNLITFGLSKRF